MDVKGTGIIVLPGFIKQQFGEQGYRQWLEALTPQARQVYEGIIGINDWYPIRATYLEPTEVLCRLFYRDDHKGAWELGRYSAEYALKGVYRAFVKLTSVQFFIRRAGVVLPTYYRPSAIEIAFQGERKTVLRIVQFPEYSPLIEQRIGGWIERSFEIHNCQGIEVKIDKSMARGDSCTEFVVTWEE